MEPGRLHYPAGLPCWLIMYFHSTAENLGVEGWRTLRAGSLRLWSPGEPQAYGHAGAPWVHSWVHVEGREIPELLAEAGLDHGVPLWVGRDAMVGDYIRRLLDERSLHRHPHRGVLRAILLAWLLEMGRVVQAPGQAPVHPGIEGLKVHLDAATDRPLRLRQMSEIARLSPSHLSAEFRKHYGESPVRYHLQRRLNHARFLIEERGLRVSEAADAVGFPDVFSFSRMFRRVVGMPPSAFRPGNPRPLHRARPGAPPT